MVHAKIRSLGSRAKIVGMVDPLPRSGTPPAVKESSLETEGQDKSAGIGTISWGFNKLGAFLLDHVVHLCARSDPNWARPKYSRD